MILEIRPLQLNVDFVVGLLGEIVGMETAVLLSRAFYFFRRVAGNGRNKLWVNFGNVQGSGMLVQVSRCLKSKIHQLFAGQGVLHFSAVGRNLPNNAST